MINHSLTTNLQYDVITDYNHDYKVNNRIYSLIWYGSIHHKEKENTIVIEDNRILNTETEDEDYLI